MHEVLRPGMEVNELLNGLGASGVSIWSLEIILQSKCASHAEVSNLHCNWEPDIEFHRSDNGVSHGCEPVLIEIRVITLEKSSEKIALLCQIGVTEHQQETCVEEDADEYTVGNVLHLSGLGVASNTFNDNDNYHSDDSVQDNDEVLDHVVHNKDFPSSLLVLFANFFRLFFIVNVHDVIICCVLLVNHPLLRS